MDAGLVEVAPGVALWAERTPARSGRPGAPVVLLADADEPALFWPDELVDRLAAEHPVLRHDQRDTGRATRSPHGEPTYGPAQLARDALTVLDAGPDRGGPAHLVGMGLGATLVQLLLLDHPHRIASATLIAGRALAGAPKRPTGPGPTQALLWLWAERDDPRDDAGELAWRVEHRRLLHGTGLPFDAAEFRAREQRALAHAGAVEPAWVHDRMLDDDADRGAELGPTGVPVLVIEAPDDPVLPPPHAEHLAAVLGARWVTVPGLGHTVPRLAVPALADAVAGQLDRVRTR